MSLPNLLLVGLFKYRPSVLDAWVTEYVPRVRIEFNRLTTVKERTVHVAIPVELDGRIVPALRPQDLKNVLARGRTSLLIWGEGGAGKTSLACQIAQWGMASDKEERLFAQIILPVIIEQDLNLEVRKDKDVFTEVVRGKLRELIGEADAPSEELVRHLLRRQRILVIVDGLSELDEPTRNRVRPVDPEFAATMLVVTSRTEEGLDEVVKAKLHPMRIRGGRLSSFIEAYLLQCGKRELFPDAEFFDGCSKLSAMVGDRDITVLLAKLFAEQMIALKEGADERWPENVPDLMLNYLNELNRKARTLEDRAVHAAAKVVAWECLKQTFRPGTANINGVLEGLGGGNEANDRVRYLEQDLRLVQIIGAGRDRVKFGLDPLAEYLSGLHLIEQYRDNSQLWQEFLDRAADMRGAPEAIKGFLVAVRDCCLTKGAEMGVPHRIADELGRRAGLVPVAPRISSSLKL